MPIETQIEPETLVEQEIEIQTETINSFTKPKIFEGIEYNETILQISAFVLVFLIVFGLIYRRCRKIKARSIMTLSIDKYKGSMTSSRVGTDNSSKTVYLPMAGD